MFTAQPPKQLSQCKQVPKKIHAPKDASRKNLRLDTDPLARNRSGSEILLMKGASGARKSSLNRHMHNIDTALKTAKSDCRISFTEQQFSATGGNQMSSP